MYRLRIDFQSSVKSKGCTNWYLASLVDDPTLGAISPLVALVGTAEYPDARNFKAKKNDVPMEFATVREAFSYIQGWRGWPQKSKVRVYVERVS